MFKSFKKVVKKKAKTVKSKNYGVRVENNGKIKICNTIRSIGYIPRSLSYFCICGQTLVSHWLAWLHPYIGQQTRLKVVLTVCYSTGWSCEQPVKKTREDNVKNV